MTIYVTVPDNQLVEKENYDDFDGWLCDCGHWEELPFHCSKCFQEPPWGCDCGYHEDNYWDWDE